jgi:diaminopimelate epimerase
MRTLAPTQPQKNEPVPFTKMAGAGNDFVVIDHRVPRITDAADFTRRICTRRLSVGADGVILIESSARATFRMRYFNSDGSLGELCANGTRCAARFAFVNVIAPRRMTIETDAGIVGAEIGDRGEVTLALPAPEGFRPEMPLAIGGRTIHGSFIMVGVPHYVTFLRDDLWAQKIEPLGRAIRMHPDLQPAGANANFVVVRDPHSIEVRTYERGVEGETLACGSGVVASVSTSALFGKVQSPVSVLTRSGATLEVTFELADSWQLAAGGRETAASRQPPAASPENVHLKGDARIIYRSTLTPETVEGFDAEFARDPTARLAVT